MRLNGLRGGAALHVGRWPLHPLDFGLAIFVGDGFNERTFSVVVQECVLAYLPLSCRPMRVLTLRGSTTL